MNMIRFFSRNTRLSRFEYQRFHHRFEILKTCRILNLFRRLENVGVALIPRVFASCTSASIRFCTPACHIFGELIGIETQRFGVADENFSGILFCRPILLRLIDFVIHFKIYPVCRRPQPRAMRAMFGCDGNGKCRNTNASESLYFPSNCFTTA